MKVYLNNLTALRGIAALLVVVLHFHFFMGAIIPREWTGFINKLYLMVDLFFILSGFVICYVYQETFQSKFEGKKYVAFLLLRLARIYPLHVITLLAEACVFGAYVFSDNHSLLNQGQLHLYRWEGIPVQLTFLQTVGIFNFDTWNAPAWSLSAEWWAYVLFPFVLLLSIRSRSFAWVGLPIVFIGGWLTCEFYLAPRQPFLTYPPNPEHTSLDLNWYWGTLRGIFGFIAGMFVFQLYQKGIFKKILSHGWILLLLVTGVVSWMHFKGIDTVTVMMFAVIILSSAYGSPAINKFFRLAILQKLGEWSFSIYLWHMVLLNALSAYFIFQRDKPSPGLLRPFEASILQANLALLACLLVILVVGKLSYRFIEKPSRAYLRKLIFKRR